MPPSTPFTEELAGQEETLSVLVTDHWVDDFCEHVGSLCAVLQALLRVEGTDRPPALILEALKDCASLQDLLNAIPVWGGQVVSHSARSAITAGRVAHSPRVATPPSAVLANLNVSSLGDSFPELAAVQDDALPAVDQGSLEERCQHDVDDMLKLLRKFGQLASN